MRVQLIGRPESRVTGLTRYLRGLQDGLRTAGIDAELTFPIPPPLPGSVARALKGIGIDVQAFFASYPLGARRHRADIYHLTDQMLATLLLFQRYPGPVVVTVMDIIPYLVQHTPDLATLRHAGDRRFYGMAIAGLSRADALVAISDYTKQTLVDVLGLDERRIAVVYPSIDPARFHPAPVPDEFLAAYGLRRDLPYLLFVGSEDPRKNVRVLVRALDQVRRAVPDVVLLKVGAFEFADERVRIVNLIRELDLGRHVRFFEYVADDDLPHFYNLASMTVLPSLYEGFGLPIGEAMACGRPVVCSRAGPLPEVVGSAAVVVERDDPGGLAAAIVTLLRDPAERARLGEAGRLEAGRFAPPVSAAAMARLYADLLERRARDRQATTAAC